MRTMFDQGIETMSCCETKKEKLKADIREIVTDANHEYFTEDEWEVLILNIEKVIEDCCDGGCDCK